MRKLFHKTKFLTKSYSQKSCSGVVYQEHGNVLNVCKYVFFKIKNFRIDKLELPEVKDKRVLVKMLAAPINPADLNMIQGNYGVQVKLPAVGGSEGVGVVEKVGEGVTELKVGQRVIPSKYGLGTWREYIVSNEEEFDVIADDIPVEYASTIAVNPCTGYRLLHDFEKLKPGDVIVQNGANSTCGQAILQIAKSMGVITVNIMRSRPNEKQMVERLKFLGGDVVVTEDYATTYGMVKVMNDLPKPKLAFNCVGGDSTRTLLKLLGNGGKLITYGGMSRKPITIPSAPLIFNDIKLEGFWLTKWVKEHSKEERREMLDQVTELIRNKKLTLFLQTHKFSEIHHALKTLMEPYNDRKIVLDLTQ